MEWAVKHRSTRETQNHQVTLQKLLVNWAQDRRRNNKKHNKQERAPYRRRTTYHLLENKKDIPSTTPRPTQHNQDALKGRHNCNSETVGLILSLEWWGPPYLGVSPATYPTALSKTTTLPSITQASLVKIWKVKLQYLTRKVTTDVSSS